MNTNVLELAKAALSCKAIRDRGSRDTIVDRLPSEIKTTITRNATDQVDVVNIISRCADFEDGLGKFMEILLIFEGDSIPMKQVLEIYTGNHGQSRKRSDATGNLKKTAENSNPAAIRELVDAAFNDEDLDMFCFDHFPEVRKNFAAGQTKGARVVMLVDYAQRYGHVEKLLRETKRLNPYQYGKYESRP